MLTISSNKEAQAALEYLMTYGFALVIIAIAVAVLIFMGIIKLPTASNCLGLDKLAYSDHTIDSNGTFILYLKNGTGMQITNIQATPGSDFSGNCSASSQTINATKDFNVVCTNTGVSAGQTYNGKITIEYMRRNARHTESASCTGTAPLSGIFLVAPAAQIIEGFFIGSGNNLDLNNLDEMLLGSGNGSYASFGSYTSIVFDANSTMDWSASISWDENTPTGTDINLQTRTSDNNAVWSSWSGYYTNPSGGAITSPNGRFIQYKANLSTTNSSLTPKLLEVRLHGNPLAQSCGNLKKEGTEQCDTNDLGGATCITLGYVSGALACTGACAFDTNGCVSAPALFCPGTKAWNSQADFISGAGNYTNATSSPGNLVLESLPGINIVPDANTKLLFHFNELGGSTANDSSGNGNNGTVYGAAWNTYGVLGNALQFDGIDDYANAGNNSSLNLGNGNFTIEGWFMRFSLSTNQELISKHQQSPDRANYEIYFGDPPTDNVLKARFTYNNGTWMVVSFSAATVLSNWYHFALVRSENTIYAYFNGVLQGQADLTGKPLDAIPDSNLLIGIRDIGNLPFNGRIDEVAIHNRALSSNEIFAHFASSGYYNSGAWSAIFDANATADWNAIAWGEDINYGSELMQDANTKLLMHFNEGSGATTADSSGNGYNGTISGAAWTSSGKFGNALSFDGIDDYVQTAPISGPGTEFTVETWSYPMAYDGYVFWHLGSYGYLYYYNSGEPLQVYFPGTCNTYVTPFCCNVNIPFNTWHHIAYSYGAGRMRVYYDGNMVSDIVQSCSVGTNSDNADIGLRTDAPGSRRFNGLIDEVAIYDRALSPSEILEHYRKGISNLRLRTRTADTNSNLANAAWSAYYADSPSAIASADNRFIEVQALLETSNASYTPMLQDLNISC